MLIGTALTFRLKQMSRRIERISTLKVNNINQWKVVRKDYIRLTELCYEVNSRLSAIIMMSFLTNMYFVLLQIFLSMNPMENLVQKIYFYLSFGLILIRIVGLCVFGGAVYEEWRNLGFLLNCVVTTTYNQEVERMACHVISWELSLSGKNFFHISRSLILKIAGAVVTYELVLIQFYRNAQYNSM
ncbi:gustatory receptor for sugar taste 64f [Leptinotarsa decemlineata]|uniref:gustatory receptor for sugar taste 64f n=1 Tax=Leptinotarsa decemlineata TaxID=7539 RepID=UPI003D307251